MNSGVYQIRNVVSGDVYIGSTRNIRHRKISHFSQLKRGKHENQRLLKSCQRHGIENLEFSVIEYVESIEDLTRREQFWLDTIKPTLNILAKADNHSLNLTDEWRESRRRLGKLRKGKYKMSEENIAKLSERMKRDWADPIKRQKRLPTPEMKKTISDGACPYLHIFISPDGSEVVVRSVKRFAEEMGLSSNWMQHVASGRRKSNAGWTLKERVYIGYKKDR